MFGAVVVGLLLRSLDRDVLPFPSRRVFALGLALGQELAGFGIAVHYFFISHTAQWRPFAPIDLPCRQALYNGAARKSAARFKSGSPRPDRQRLPLKRY